MNTNMISRSRRVLLTGLTLGALAASGTLATATSATAEPVRTDRTFAAPPAVPGVPDIGTPAEAGYGRGDTTIDPRNLPVPSRTGSESAVTRAGATATTIVANGARVRSYPVTGKVVGMAYYGEWYWVSCKRRATDGYVWGYGTVGSRRGWIRDDLWDVVYFTAPGAPAPRPIPWC